MRTKARIARLVDRSGACRTAHEVLENYSYAADVLAGQQREREARGKEPRVIGSSTVRGEAEALEVRRPTPNLAPLVHARERMQTAARTLARQARALHSSARAQSDALFVVSAPPRRHRGCR